MKEPAYPFWCSRCAHDHAGECPPKKLPAVLTGFAPLNEEGALFIGPPSTTNRRPSDFPPGLSLWQAETYDPLTGMWRCDSHVLQVVGYHSIKSGNPGVWKNVVEFRIISPQLNGYPSQVMQLDLAAWNPGDYVPPFGARIRMVPYSKMGAQGQTGQAGQAGVPGPAGPVGIP
jgi:hypothetical protein